MKEFLEKIVNLPTPRTATREISGIKILSREEMRVLLEERTQADFGMTADQFMAAHAAGTLPDNDPNVHHDAILAGLSPAPSSDSR